MLIEMIPIVSTHLTEVGYDEVSETLRVKFYNGTLYEYHNVPKSIFTSLMDAASPGRFFHRFVRGHYDYRSLPAEG